VFKQRAISYLVDFVLLHRLLNLPDRRLFQRDSAALFEDAFLLQETCRYWWLEIPIEQSFLASAKDTFGRTSAAVT
jgi:hypothetical protein